MSEKRSKEAKGEIAINKITSGEWAESRSGLVATLGGKVRSSRSWWGELWLVLMVGCRSSLEALLTSRAPSRRLTRSTLLLSPTYVHVRLVRAGDV